ncbi:MAG TPA: YetF domain-containing protein [Actinomycetota bacterium]
MVDRAMEGTETRLVEDGAFLDRELRGLGIRTTDVEVALRRQGAEHMLQVKQADLYRSGAIVVELRPEAHGASLSDIDRLER